MLIVRIRNRSFKKSKSLLLGLNLILIINECNLKKLNLKNLIFWIILNFNFKKEG